MAIFDVLRGAYAAGGPSLKRVAGPVIALVPTHHRLGGTYRRYREFIERSKTDPQFVAEWQRDRLAQLLTRAARTDWYSDALPSGLTEHLSHDIKDPGALLRDMPILTRQTVSDRAADLVDGDPSALDTVTTSGSSGKAATLYMPRTRGAIEWAFRQDAWANVGYCDGEARGVLRTQSKSAARKVSWDAGLRELRISVVHLTPEHLDDFCSQLVRRRIRYLHGYPSAISAVASHVAATAHPAGELIRGVLTISEPLYPSQRAIYRLAFPFAGISNFYGLSEKVLFGVEDQGDPGSFEINPLYGIGELVDSNGSTIVTPGEKGRVIGTGLLFQDMPLIRYETGDTAELVDNARAENGFRLKLRDLKPKKALDYLVGRNGQQIPLHSFDAHLHSLLLAQHIQFVQERPGKVTLRLVPAGGVESSRMASIGREVAIAVDNQVEVEVQVVDAIETNPRGKVRYVVQNCALNEATSWVKPEHD